MDIRFNAGSHLREQAADKAAWDKELAERLEQIVQGSGIVHEKDQNHWQLGTSNNWWLKRDIETGEFVLTYRYGCDGDPRLLALRQAIIFILALEPFNKN